MKHNKAGIQEALRHFGLDINIPVDSDSEPENDFPTFFIHELNECLSVLVSDTENYMFDMDEEDSFSKALEVLSINENAFKMDKKNPDFY